MQSDHLLAAAILAAFGPLLGGCSEEEPPVDPALRAGKWSRVPDRAPRFSDGMTEEQRRVAEELASIGYADGTQAAPALVSVTTHDPEQAFEGYNFYTSGHATEAYLVDMEGRLLHRWRYDYDRLWPDLEVPENAAGKGKWRRAHLFPNGDILAIHEGIGMIKLDRDSNLLWEYPGYAHHDLHVMEDGTIWTLARLPLMIPRIDPDLPSLDDYVVQLDADGHELRRCSLLEALERGGCQELLDRVEYKDMFHTNSIEVLDGRLADRLPEFRAGNVLISIRHVSAVAVLDVEREEVVWWMDGDFSWQHDAKILPDGTLMLFDNRGLNTETSNGSRVLVFDPVERELLWSYRGTPELPFYSRTCGTAYRLPNGNLLVNESDGGRSFELNAREEIVWEFFNPHRAGASNELIACLYDVQRFPPGPGFGWLAQERAAPPD